MKKVACLSRVSTDEQHTSIENQREIFSNWLSKNKDCVLYKYYVDEGISGTKAYKRVAFLEMLEDGKNKKFDILLCKSFSRFGRNMTDTLQAIKDLRACNIRIIFLEDNLDTEKDITQFGLFSWLAENESQNTSKRIKAVWNTYNEQGKIHNCIAPYGYEYSKEQKNFIINEEESKIVKEIFELYLSGYGFTKIARMLVERGVKTKKGGNWQGSTIKNIIKNEVYCGTLVQGKTSTIDVTMKQTQKINNEDWKKHYDHHEPIISYEIFEKAQEEARKRGDFAKDNTKHFSNKNLFSNILICGNCKATMTAKRKKNKFNYKPYYLCNEYSLHSKKCGHKSNQIYEDFLINHIRKKLDELVATQFKEIKDKLKLKDKSNNTKKLENDLRKINKEIEEKTKQSTKLLSLLASDKLQEEQFTLMNKDIAKQITILNTKKAEIERKLKKNSDVKEEEKELKKGIINLIDTDINDWTNSMLREIIDKILVYDDKTITIEYKYTNDL